MKTLAARTMCCLMLTVTAMSAPADEPRVFLFDGAHLANMQQEIREQPEKFAEALEDLCEQADAVLDQGPWSVMDKDFMPPSGDKHDYFSLGPYWWPDPSTADGLPYIRRDGEVNPERDKYDSPPKGRMTEAVNALARAWYFTGEEKYARRAALLLRTWFLDPATRMNPHLRFGQAVRGRNTGRGIGIIDTASWGELVDSVGLLKSSRAWTDEDQQQLQAWFRDYIRWLTTSEMGLDEADQHNNHAVYYDVQVASFALFTGDRDLAVKVLSEVGPRRIATQIEPDGSMPHELARTKSWGYTTMNLRGFLHLARLGEHVEVDLWHFHTADGRSIEQALNWLAPFVLGEKEWSHKQIATFKTKDAAIHFRRALPRLDKPNYREAASRLDNPVSQLLWP